MKPNNSETKIIVLGGLGEVGKNMYCLMHEDEIIIIDAGISFPEGELLGPFVEGEDNSLLDVLPNDDSPSADRGLVNESLNTEIERALSTLTDREREIIKSFFGIGCQEMTLEEIGERFGLTRERVRQIKEKAIRRLKSPSRSKLLKSYLG